MENYHDMFRRQAAELAVIKVRHGQEREAWAAARKASQSDRERPRRPISLWALTCQELLVAGRTRGNRPFTRPEIQALAKRGRVTRAMVEEFVTKTLNAPIERD